MKRTGKKQKERPATEKQWALYRCKLACGIGKDACEGKRIPECIRTDDWRMYQLFCAIEDLAKAMEE